MTDDEKLQLIQYIFENEERLAMVIEALKKTDTKDMDPEAKASHDRSLKSQMLVEALGVNKKNSIKGHLSGVTIWLARAGMSHLWSDLSRK